ncbi:MAG: ferredoxin family protein [Oscillospiraceae bacterium]
MSILIDKEKCIGCGKCCGVCPGTLIKKDENGKAYIKYPKECWGCTSCVKECPVNAVKFYLGADIGGKGSLVHTEKRDGLLCWMIEHPDKNVTEIDIDPNESNKY